MSILSDFFISDDSSASRYDSADFPDQDRCQFRRITPLEAAGLLVALRGSGDRVDATDEFELITPEDAEEWTMRVPEEFVSLISCIAPAEIPVVAAKFAELTQEEIGWEEGDAIPVIQDLSALARRAVNLGKQMYLWNSL